jgi:hypothetical protein
MLMFHFMWIESTIVGIDDIQIVVLWIGFISLVHGVLWKKLISHYKKEIILLISDFYLYKG